MKTRILIGLVSVCAFLSGEAIAAPPPASAFAALPEMSMVRLSPNGQRVAWANDPGGTPFVIVFDLATGKDLKRLQPANSRVRDLDWADDRTLIISVSRSLTSGAGTVAENRYEFERYLALDVDNPKGEARSLLMENPERENVTGASLEKLHTATPGKVMMSTLSFSAAASRSEIGSRISGGRKDSGYEQSLFEVETSTGDGRKIESGTPFTDTWVLDPAGHAVARVEWNPSTSQYAIYAREATAWHTIFSASDYRYDVAGLAADGKSLLATSGQDSGHSKAWSIPIAGGAPTVFYEDPQFDVTSVVFDRFSGAPAGFWIGGPQPAVHWIDPKMESIQKAVSKAFAGKATVLLDRSADYKRVVVSAESGSSPPMYYLIDFAKGSADIIGEAYPALADVALGNRRSHALQDARRLRNHGLPDPAARP